jgi:hypothetical protein
MPLFMDIHNHVPGLRAEAVAGAHLKDLETQAKYGVKFLNYWFDEGTGKVFCLMEAPSKEAAGTRSRLRRDYRSQGRRLETCNEVGSCQRRMAGSK